MFVHYCPVKKAFKCPMILVINLLQMCQLLTNNTYNNPVETTYSIYLKEAIKVWLKITLQPFYLGSSRSRSPGLTSPLSSNMESWIGTLKVLFICRHVHLNFPWHEFVKLCKRVNSFVWLALGLTLKNKFTQTAVHRWKD